MGPWRQSGSPPRKERGCDGEGTPGKQTSRFQSVELSAGAGVVEKGRPLEELLRARVG